MSETPRTEKRLAEVYQVPIHEAAPIVDAAFARTLEREIAVKDARVKELETALASEKDDKDTAIEILNRRGEMLSAERAHADRLAEALVLAFKCDDNYVDSDGPFIAEVLAAHEARRKGGENTQPEPTPRDGVTTD